MMRRLLLLATAMVAMVFAAAPAALARAQEMAPTVRSADPPPGSQMHKAPAEVTLTFSEPLDPSSTMSVRDSCKQQIDNGAVVINLTEMRVGIQDTPSGVYKVAFTAVGVGGVTGETSDSYTFTVHGGKPCGSMPPGHDHGGGPPDEGHDHGGMPGEPSGHGDDSGDHEDMDHGSTSEDGHGNRHGGGGHQHGGNGHNGGRDGGGNGPNEGTEIEPPVAIGPQAGGYIPVTPLPSGTAILAALAGATIVGALGGLILRLSAST